MLLQFIHDSNRGLSSFRHWVGQRCSLILDEPVKTSGVNELSCVTHCREAGFNGKRSDSIGSGLRGDIVRCVDLCNELQTNVKMNTAPSQVGYCPVRHPAFTAMVYPGNIHGHGINRRDATRQMQC